MVRFLKVFVSARQNGIGPWEAPVTSGIPHPAGLCGAGTAPAHQPRLPVETRAGYKELPLERASRVQAPVKVLIVIWHLKASCPNTFHCITFKSELIRDTCL